MKNTHVYILATLLTAIGFAGFGYKAAYIGMPLTSDESTDLWEVEAQIVFEAKGGPTKLSFFVPDQSDRYSIVHQSFDASGFGLSTGAEGANPKQWPMSFA